MGGRAEGGARAGGGRASTSASSRRGGTVGWIQALSNTYQVIGLDGRREGRGAGVPVFRGGRGKERGEIVGWHCACRLGGSATRKERRG